MKLTNKELHVAALFANASLWSCSSFTEESNMSYMNAQDIAEETGWSLQAVGGVMASLVEKGLIQDYGDSARGAKINDFIANEQMYMEHELLKPFTEADDQLPIPTNESTEETSMQNEKVITKISTADLVAFFNSNSAKPIKKFADRATAEKRVLKMVREGSMQDLFKKLFLTVRKSEQCPHCGATENQSETKKSKYNLECADCGAVYDVDTGTLKNLVDEPKITKTATKKAIKAAKKQAGERKSSSHAIAASWLEPKVAIARSTRHGVKVDGKLEFNSVREAFVKLDLPLGKHIKFRMKLKAAHKENTTPITEFGKTWTLIELSEK